MWLVGALVYLIPIAAFLVARADKDEPLWQMALDIPSAVALDVLLVLLLARAMPLETAAWVSRAVEIPACAAWLRWRMTHGAAWGRPKDLNAYVAATVLCAAAAACQLSLIFSRKYHIWDRYWHVNLVTSIRGQRLPFANVYDPSGPLSYHYAGDALAAMLQTFSFDTIHSSHALSLVHDLMFTLTGAVIALLLVAWGARGIPTVTLASLAWFLTGPSTLMRDDNKQWVGYDFVNYYTLSFRPHASLAGLALVGFVGAVLARIAETRDTAAPRAPPGATLVALLSTAAILAISDEASCGLLGLALGLSWLIWPGVLGLERKRGVLVMLGLLAAVIGANLLYAGLFSPGAERPPIKLVAWRAPGFEAPTLPFDKPFGEKRFFGDLVGLISLGIAGAWAFARKRTRLTAATSAFVLALIVGGIVALGRLDIPPRPVEAHRFITAPMLAAPLVALYWLLADKQDTGRSPTVLTASLFGLGLAALSTFAFIQSPGATALQRGDSFFTKEDFYRTDCRTELGARFGERPHPTYLERSVFFVYTGCHPVFTSGLNAGHKIKTSRPQQGFPAFVNLNEEVLRPGEPLDVVCPKRGSSDVVCQRAMQNPCTDVGKDRLGTEIVRCVLDADARQRLLAEHAPKTPPAPKLEPPRENEAPP